MRQTQTSDLNRLRHAGVLAILSFILCLSGCVGTVSRVHVDDEPLSDVGASDVDIRTMAREMATAIVELPIIDKAKEPVTIAFVSIENRTLDPNFNSYNLLSKIRQHLIVHAQGKAVFLDRELSNAIWAERDAKRAGQLTTKDRKDLPGADFFLTGQAYERRTTGSSGKVMSAHRYSFRMTDTEDGHVVWEKDYEFKKVGQRPVSDR